MNHLLLLLLASFVTLFQTGKTMAQTTTFIIVRHAEKENMGADANLSAEGKARAEDFKRMFLNVPISAIYSTPYHRTRQTVAPLALEKGIAVAEYQPATPARQLAERWLAMHRGQTVVICGHSNTVPEIVNALGKTALPITISEPHFDNVFLITCPENAAPALLQLKYGKSTP